MPVTRFRHRNALYTSQGYTKILQYAKQGVCQASPTWGTIYQGGLPTRKLGKVDYMIDVPNDPPVKTAGVFGFKFHPMTQVRCEISGVGFSAWATTPKAILCTEAPGYEYQARFMSAHGAGYDQNVAWAGFEHKMLGDQLDLGTYNIPWGEMEISKDLAATQALSKRGRSGESNLYESLAEIRKTINTFSDVLTRARKIHDAIFWGDRGGKSRKRVLTEEAAGQLLMTNYGWKPLMSDINGILVGLEKAIGSRIISSRGQHKVSRTTNTVLPVISDSDAVLWGRQITSNEEWTARAVSVDQFMVTQLNNLGLSLKDLILVPWELVRYSHVVDWFLNAGDLLGAMVQDPNLLNLGQSVSIRYKRTEVCTFWYAGQPVAQIGNADVNVANPAPPVTRVLEYYDRQPGPLVPQLRLRPDSLDFMKVLNALAMFTMATAKVKATLKVSQKPSPAAVKDVRFSKELRERIWNGRLPANQWIG
jgi:hypothetical protein